MDTRFTQEEIDILTSFVKKEQDLACKRYQDERLENARTLGFGFAGYVGYAGTLVLEASVSFNVFLEEVPLYINSEDPVVLGIAKGRLYLGK